MDGGGDGVCSGGGNAMTKVVTGITDAQGMQDLGTVSLARRSSWVTTQIVLNHC